MFTSAVTLYKDIQRKERELGTVFGNLIGREVKYNEIDGVITDIDLGNERARVFLADTGDDQWIDFDEIMR